MLGVLSLRRARRLAPALALAALVLPGSAGTASANRTQGSILEDDRVLYNQGPAAQARALDSMAALGVDTIHTLLHWRGLLSSARAWAAGPWL